MTTINVIIPSGGTKDNPVEPILSPQLQAIPRNKMIVWNFSTENQNVDKVEVQFESKYATFFPGAADETRFQQKVIYRKNSKDEGRPGQSLIWGLAPDYSNHVKDKYVVNGLDADGKVIACLVPYILTTRPG